MGSFVLLGSESCNQLHIKTDLVVPTWFKPDGSGWPAYRGGVAISCRPSSAQSSNNGRLALFMERSGTFSNGVGSKTCNSVNSIHISAEARSIFATQSIRSQTILDLEEDPSFNIPSL